MSKYKERGDYHYQEFADSSTTYHKHVTDLLAQVKNYVPSGATILDIGCGEGLILSQLTAAGYNVLGCDIDKHAVQIALSKHNPVIWGTVHNFKGHTFEAVLLLDVLEHVVDVNDVLGQALDRAERLFIAIPDRPDAHAINSTDDLLDKIRTSIIGYKGWKSAYYDQRHARHLMMFTYV